MANTGNTQALSALLRGPGQGFGVDLANEVKTGTELPKAHLNAGVKRERFTFNVNAGGTVADGTTYTTYFAPGRAGVVKGVYLIASTAPVGGTNTVDVKKGGASGTSVLTAAFDPTTLVADTISTASLSGTAATVAFTATQGLYVAWVAGTQTTDGVRCSVCVEVEFDDI